MRFIDADGMIWAVPKKDSAIASEVNDRIKDKLDIKNSDLAAAKKDVANLEKQIAKNGSSEKLIKKFYDAQIARWSCINPLSEINTKISQ